MKLNWEEILKDNEAITSVVSFRKKNMFFYNCILNFKLVFNSMEWIDTNKNININ